MGLRSTRWSVIAIAGALALTVGACGGDDDDGGVGGPEGDTRRR